MPEPIRLFCIGDVHLGRRPARLPPGRSELGVARVWERFVQAALDRQVDAVVLTGDVVDEESKVFEAMRALEEGVRRLDREGVEIIAVAGNHDWDAFPRLLRNLGDAPLQFLGAGGQWETYTLRREGRPLVRFVGWSFPSEHAYTSPLDAFEFEPAKVPTLGVLHGDIDQPGSAYAPVERRELGRQPVAGWLMGHIHRSEEHYDGRQLQLYTGSPQPLHPNEPGRHGAWMVELAADGTVSATLVPLASLCYEEVPIDVSACDAIGDVEEAAGEAVRAALKARAEEMPHLRQMVCRLTFEGRTTLGRAIDAWAPAFIEEFEAPYAEARAAIDTHALDVRPAHDLDRLAASADPPGVLARLLLDLQEGEDSDLACKGLQRARQALRSVHGATGYEPLRRAPDLADPPTDEAVRRMMRRGGLLLLDELLTDRGASDDA